MKPPEAKSPHSCVNLPNSMCPYYHPSIPLINQSIQCQGKIQLLWSDEIKIRIRVLQCPNSYCLRCFGFKTWTHEESGEKFAIVETFCPISFQIMEKCQAATIQYQCLDCFEMEILSIRLFRERIDVGQKYMRMTRPTLKPIPSREIFNCAMDYLLESCER